MASGSRPSNSVSDVTRARVSQIVVPETAMDAFHHPYVMARRANA
jgi:hypothetical protein